MNTFGKKTPPTVILTHESHKLHTEFVVGATIGRSQAVKVDEDGELVPLEAGDNRNLCIGISAHFAVAGGLATVIMKPYLTLLCRAGGTIAPGPVKVSGYYTDPNRKQSADIGEDGPGWGTNIVVQGAADGSDADFFGITVQEAAVDGFVEVYVYV